MGKPEDSNFWRMAACFAFVFVEDRIALHAIPAKTAKNRYNSHMGVFRAEENSKGYAAPAIISIG